jgi:pyridoxamine 5'-phosphate oxidase
VNEPAQEPPDAFDPATAEHDPLARFGGWWAQAREVSPFADAMALATASPDGQPSVRMVLVRGFEPDGGFVFFTNYESAKAADLATNPRAALVFHWPELHRQVRVTGPAERLTTAESDAYWQGRPRDHRLGAWASPQSRVLADRAELERAMAQASDRFAEDVPLPPFWGGYRVRPDTIEFWQGRESRLHDRVRYTRDDDAWVIERLAP